MCFTILGSSSSGNCSLLATNHCKILIDAGYSGKQLCKLLDSVGESIDNIDAVFLTHEHTDHTAGIRGLSRFQHLEFYANHGTAKAVQSKLSRRPSWKLFETGTTFQFRDLDITSFSIPHDAYDPVGFIFKNGNGELFTPYRSLAWATDLGYVSELVKERIRQVDVLVLEANHDIEMLNEDTKRPWAVKQRITGRHGHLSNHAAKELLDTMEEPRWKQVYLAHLSKDCNSVEKVAQTVTNGKNHTRAYNITVVPPGETVPPFEL
ncbi:MAG: MBL fold metallo-hydrolase [Verrucomicrobia bacterium]|nr:MBL fold metallo-hydrolase [Verrucomicrobiota bacterium]